MKRNLFLLIVCYCFFCSGSADIKPQTKQDRDPICANDSFYLTPQQVIAKQDEALRGNGRAARDLGMYYAMLSDNKLMRDLWLYIGMKLDDELSVIRYNHYVNKGHCNPEQIFVVNDKNIRSFQEVPKTDLFLLYFNYQQALRQKDKGKSDRCREKLLQQKVDPRLL